MQSRGRLPGLEADGGNGLTGAASGGHRHPPAVAGHDMAALDKALRLDLQPLYRRIDIAHGAAGRALFAEHMPGLQRLPQFERDAAMMDAAESRKTKLELGRIPFRREFVAGLPELIEHAEEIFPEEMRQHEAIVQRRTPADELALLRFAPELCDQRADQELLRQRHPGIGWHFERTEFD